MSRNSRNFIQYFCILIVVSASLLLVQKNVIAKIKPSPDVETVPNTLSSTENWDQLFKACQGDWEQYEIGLNRLRNSLKREIDVMTRDEFLRRYVKNDEMIRFVRIHWPILFSSKDTGWRLFQGCAERNFKARKLIGTVGTPPKERDAKIEDLTACLHEVFGKNQPLVKPFDRLIACYRGHLK